MAGKKPERKRFGRDSPPKGYPKNQSLYADPDNWRYPLHTSWHARAARRYFDDPANRNKYSPEEQEYIDWRINLALSELKDDGVVRKPTSRTAPAVPANKIAELSLDELLRKFLGAARLERAKQIDDSLVSITLENSDLIEGKVKDYVVRIDIPNRTILHDCQDWQNNMDSKNMCKHVGKLLLTLDEGKATNILRAVLREMGEWSFTSPKGEKG